MALISLREACFDFGGGAILDHAHLNLKAGERVGLVGRNGAGKSTLMQILAGEIALVSGERSTKQNLRIARLDQEVPKGIQGPLYEYVVAGAGAIGEDLANYRLLHLALEANADDESVLEEMGEIQDRLAEADGWELQSLADRLMSRMELDPALEIAELSAGLKRRVLLARSIMSSPDLLMLDEPTNHLDIEAIQWLEEFLLAEAPTLLFVSHDREFMRRVSTRILDLDRGTLTSYRGSYDEYLVAKEIDVNLELERFAKEDKKLKIEEEWLRRGMKARRKRDQGRVRALKGLRAERAERRDHIGVSKANLQESRASGRLVVEAKNLSKRYGSEVLFRDFDCRIMRGEKIGILGPNGCGKTTLIRCLLGQLELDEGTIRLGSNVEVAYFDQLNQTLDESLSLADNIGEGNDTITIGGVNKHVLGYLQDFLFSPQESRKPVSKLSGGERNRLLLAKLFTKTCNVLVMDEPTNDLDIETMELLESLLLDFSGTLLLVSHDRQFIDNVVTSTLVFEGNEQLKEYAGGYEDWRRQSKVLGKNGAAAKTSKKNKSSKSKEAPKVQKQKLGYKEKRELEALPAQIEVLEAAIATVAANMADPEFYKLPADTIQRTQAELKAQEVQLEGLVERWAELEDRAS